MEFHIARALRERLGVDELLFSFSGNVVFGSVAASQRLAQRLNEARGAEADPAKVVSAGALYAMGLIDELNHALIARYREEIDPAVLSEAVRWAAAQVNPSGMERLLAAFTEEFPSVAVYRGKQSVEEWLNGETEGMPNREAAFEELLMLWLANSNPAFAPFRELFDDTELKEKTPYPAMTSALPDFFATRPPIAPEVGSLLDALRAPMLASPDSLTGQLDFIREQWTKHLGEDLRRVLLAIDVIREEDIALWMRFHPPSADRHRHGAQGWVAEGFAGDEYVGFEDGGEQYETGPDGVRRRRRRYAADYQAPLHEYEAFSADQAWMPTVVLIAKSTYVWLEQLSKKYGRHIQRLDQIPDEELQLLASRGVTGLWLIGLWERSKASQTIKRLRGNSDAVASAYSLKGYSIAEDLGGEAACENLRDRAGRAGLRLASDMVPNHMGIDSDWVIENPEWFLFRDESPFPVYGFEGPDLSTDSRVEIKIEDHYYDQTDAAVVFRLRHHREGRNRFVYHGNDGTTFAWNDTAQLDYSKAAVREHVMQTILDVARRFPIIRFDAAMVLAKRHVQRLWFPLPGAGGSIPSRAENALSQEEFEALMPHEFWREVVDRVAVEVPGTLLLAEAFWLLESYFVRTLGMHRVYNSAFMNMLRDEENAKYRSYLKKTVEFDPDILKRYVNFMSNPDERTAIDQFGSGDKYFGVCALLATLPGLPMLGHGQVEGFTERYGMDFKQARLEEYPNEGLIARHQKEIAPLLKNRALFADSTNFVMYDYWTGHGTVDENVFAYSNRFGGQSAIILYNNSYGSTHGTIHVSVAAMDKGSGSLRQKSLAEGLALPGDDSTIVAYRETVSGLAYLRRAKDFHDHGLTLGLRGFQHVVLLEWRELRPSADQPWDQLCDSLNGSGVYSVEEALSRLRMRPLHEALRQAVSASNIHAFAAVVRELLEEEGRGVGEDSADAVEPAAPVAAIKHEEPAEEPIVEQPSATWESMAENTVLDPRLKEFVEKSERFFERTLVMAEASGELKIKQGATEDTFESAAAQSTPADDVALLKPLSPEEPVSSYRESCRKMAAGVVHLASFEAMLSKSSMLSKPLMKAVRSMFPSHGGEHNQEHIWAPILAWIALRSLLSQGFELTVVDTLQLRAALAETFSSIGMEGETAWRAAARVRALLFHEADTMHAKELWADGDVRWLAGVHEAFGTTYFKQERFEQLLCWLQIPSLVEIARHRTNRLEAVNEVAARLAEYARAAEKAAYNLDAYLALLAAESKEEEPVSAPAPQEDRVAHLA